MSRTLDDSHRIGRRLLEVLGLKPEEAGQLKSLPFARFVTAQGEVARLEKKFADALAPFWPVIDGKVYPGEVAPALKAGAGADDRHHDRHDARGDGGVLLHRPGDRERRRRRRRRRVRIDVHNRATGPTTTRSAGCVRQAPMRRCSAI